MDKLIEILEDIKPGVDFRTNTSLIEDGILDSLAIVSIVAAVAEEFDVQIRAIDLVPENFNSAEALYALIQRLDD